ncbi:MAG: helix-turn-helix domain-containing protein [Zoogloeaceae bacterium]|nr:helix-turn-helix domain-containing protein [Zoogloeaceae bacterium]
MAARARGVKFGRRPILSSKQMSHARELLAAGRGVGDVAALLNVHRTTLQRMLKPTEDAAAPRPVP